MLSQAAPASLSPPCTLSPDVQDQVLTDIRYAERQLVQALKYAGEHGQVGHTIRRAMDGLERARERLASVEPVQ
mgnify:CR=1 FL=1